MKALVLERKGEQLSLRNIGLPLKVGPHDVAKGSSCLTYFISPFVKRPLDTTGIPSVVRQAAGSLAVRGVCGIVGASPIGTELAFDAVTPDDGRTSDPRHH
jgi:hypothetical protein